MKSGILNTVMKQCLNCQVELRAGQQYCPSCGQKTTLKKLTLGLVIMDFIKSMFNLESKIWSSLKDIWIPGKLTKAYLAGIRNRYYNPIRFFLVALFAFFALIIFISSAFIEQFNEQIELQKQDVLISSIHKSFLNLSEEYKIDSVRTKEFSDRLFTKHEPYLNKDSIGALQFDFTVGDMEEFLTLSKEELIEYDEPESKFEEIMLLATQRMVQRPRQAMSFIIGNGAWVIIITVILISFFYKLLYVRRNYLYVEHFIFHLYGHTRLLLLGLIIIPIAFWLLPTKILLWVFIIIGLVYLFLGVRKVYEQSIFKTGFKLILSLAAYMFCTSVCLTIVFLISLLIL